MDMVLIETLWNVKKRTPNACKEFKSINRNIVECKAGNLEMTYKLIEY